MAANTDKLIKLSRRWVSQIGSGGVADAEATTIPLSSVTNLPTDTAVIAVIDRVDVNGLATPTLEETVVGVVSSTNLINCTRGVEGTAQAHSAGAVVEVLYTAAGWNKMVDWGLVEHSQLGVHTSALVTSLKATGATVNTGTDDTTIVTPKALADSTIVFANSLAYQCIINGGFTVNQRVYASNATLAAGTYGHDRWKAGASGGDYTFTQLAQSTQITIKSGKSLIQVIEDKNVIGGTYTLSWTGTAKARFGKDSATPSGAYAASPITITGQTAGTVMSVEFNEGTLSNVQLNLGSVALPFMPKSFEEELRACQRYYEKSYNTETAPGTVTITGCITNLSNDTFNAAGGVGNKFSVTKRITPTITLYSTQTGSSGKVYDVSASTDNSTASASETGMSGFRIVSSTNGFTTNHYYLYHWVAEAEL